MSENSPQRSLLTTFLVHWAILGGTVITVATALRLVGMQWWVADLFCQFTVQYVFLMIPILTIVVCGKAKKATLVFAAVLLVNLIVISPAFLPATQSGDRPVGSTHRLLTQNVLTSNRDFPKMIDLIESNRPDFVILFEIDHDWVDAMKKIHVDYPHQKIMVHQGNFGVGLYSRHPWTECQIKQTGPDELPTVFAEFSLEGVSFQLVGTHPVPPLGGAGASSRNKQLVEVVLEMEPKGPRILTGDFNLTPWSAWFRAMLRRGKLRNASAGFGIQPTWHAFPTTLGGLKIDHCLVGEIHIDDFRVGPDVGSDHRAVILDFVPVRE